MTKHVYVFLILFVSSCASIDTESPYAEFFEVSDHISLIENKRYRMNL